MTIAGVVVERFSELIAGKGNDKKNGEHNLFMFSRQQNIDATRQSGCVRLPIRKYNYNPSLNCSILYSALRIQCLPIAEFQRNAENVRAEAVCTKTYSKYSLR